MIVRLSVLAAALALAALPVAAHELIVKPAATKAAPGQPLALQVQSAHVFMQSEELEVATDVAAAIFAAGKREPIALKANAATQAYEGSVAAPGGGTFILLGHRAGQVWVSTPEGTKFLPKGTPGSSNPRMFEKFAKAVVNAAPGDDGFKTVVGDRLEIVPLDNPAAVKPGQELRVQVLFDGKPLTTRVQATYDGFSTRQDTYAYSTEDVKDGVAWVKITQPGLWMVRVEHAAADPKPTHDRWVGRAVLVFAVE